MAKPFLYLFISLLLPASAGAEVKHNSDKPQVIWTNNLDLAADATYPCFKQTVDYTLESMGYPAIYSMDQASLNHKPLQQKINQHMQQLLTLANEYQTKVKQLSPSNDGTFLDPQAFATVEHDVLYSKVYVKNVPRATQTYYLCALKLANKPMLNIKAFPQYQFTPSDITYFLKLPR